MTSKFNINLESSYAELGEIFSQPGRLASFESPELIKWNGELAADLGIDTSQSSDQELARLFCGNEWIADSKPISMAYSGHQFGHFSPLLGDGRAQLLGELMTPCQTRVDIQLKGAGPTRFSRGGDGLSPMRSVVREYLVSEAMFKLGIPSTRALAAVSTGGKVHRREVLPGAVFTRVAKGHIRVGTFEYAKAHHGPEHVSRLLGYCVDRFFPDLKQDENVALAFVRRVMELQAGLIAKWLNVGFIHGVMNTDNCSIVGETIDFGPCAFMDEYDSGKVFSSIDRQGRYAYQNQPAVGLWNIARLGECFLPQDEGERSRVLPDWEQMLMEYSELMERSKNLGFRAKLGLLEEQDDDGQLVAEWLDLLEAEGRDFTVSFRKLSELVETPCKDPSEKFRKYIENWQSRVRRNSACSLEDIKKNLDAVNPCYIPRNHMIEKVIAAANDGDFSLFEELGTVLKTPYHEVLGKEDFAAPPNENEIVHQTFCGT
jgi:serine/tyrosine/threonine adenylyltransferase